MRQIEAVTRCCRGKNRGVLRSTVRTSTPHSTRCTGLSGKRCVFSDDETHAARSEFRAWFAHVQFPLPPEALTRKDCTKPVKHPNVKEMQIFAQAASAHSCNNAGSAEKRNVELENDMPEYEPVGEFGSAEWCEACGKAGAKMLQDANLPADTAWGFSETYL